MYYDFEKEIDADSKLFQVTPSQNWIEFFL